MGDLIEGTFEVGIPDPCPQCGREAGGLWTKPAFCPRCGYGADRKWPEGALEAKLHDIFSKKKGPAD